MDVSVEILGIQENLEDCRGARAFYRVIENGREFQIACRTHSHGREATLAGQDGFLYIDPSDNRVHLQTIVVGIGCGVSIDDDVVEGLSPSSLQKVLAQYDG